MATSGARKPSPPVTPDIARLAGALGLTEERVARALGNVGATPSQLLNSVREGRADERIQGVARSLRVERARLTAALLEAEGSLLGRASSAAEGLAATIKGSAEEALSIGLEIVGETIPRILNHVLAVLAAAGVAFVALGLLAIVNTPLFIQVLAIVAGLALIAAGALLFTLAFRIHEATSALRTLARVARKMRERRHEDAETGTNGR